MSIASFEYIRLNPLLDSNAILFHPLPFSIFFNDQDNPIHSVFTNDNVFSLYGGVCNASKLHVGQFPDLGSDLI